MDLLPIVKLEKRSFEVDTDVLRKVVNTEDVRDKPVVIISVAVEAGTGRALLLDTIADHLGGRYEEDMEGSLSSRSEVLMAPEVYHVVMPDGREVAALVIVTQVDSSARDSAAFLNFSLLASSMLVYSIKQSINESHINQLQSFVEYGNTLKHELDIDFPHQISFLVEGWQNLSKANYGAEGGKKILDRLLRVKNCHDIDQQTLREHLRACYGEGGMPCCLLPDPTSDENLYLSQLKDFLPSLLTPDRLTIKNQGGEEVLAKDIGQLFTSYLDIAKRNSTPSAKQMLEASGKATHLLSFRSASESYIGSMLRACTNATGDLDLNQEHAISKDLACQEFSKRKRMCKEEGDKENQLNQWMEDTFLLFKTCCAVERVEACQEKKGKGKKDKLKTRSEAELARREIELNRKEEIFKKKVETIENMRESAKIRQEAEALFEEAAKIKLEAVSQTETSIAQLEAEVARKREEACRLKEEVARIRSKVGRKTSENKASADGVLKSVTVGLASFTGPACLPIGITAEAVKTPSLQEPRRDKVITRAGPVTLATPPEPDFKKPAVPPRNMSLLEHTKDKSERSEVITRAGPVTLATPPLPDFKKPALPPRNMSLLEHTKDKSERSEVITRAGSVATPPVTGLKKPAGPPRNPSHRNEIGESEEESDERDGSQTSSDGSAKASFFGTFRKKNSSQMSRRAALYFHRSMERLF